MRLAFRDGEHAREIELAPLGEGRYRAVVDGAEVLVTVERSGRGPMSLATADGHVLAEVTAVGDRRFVRLGAMDFVLTRETAGRRRGAGGHGGGSGLEAPMPGVVTRVLVESGAAVTRGQPLVALEAMKMEHVVRAPRDGVVKRVSAIVGQLVQGGVALVELEEG